MMRALRLLEIDPAPRVSLAPVHNGLNSLALLSGPADLGEMRFPWVRETRDAMSPEQRETNRLLFSGFRHALFPDEEWHSFPAYVEHLATRDPSELRDAVSRSVRAYILPDQQIDEQVAALLTDPPRLQEVIVTHLRSVWREYLADEWERVEPVLKGLVWKARRRIASATTLSAVAQELLGRPLADVDRGGRRCQVVFVLSPHLVRHVPATGSDPTHPRVVHTETTFWVFFGMQAHPALFRRTPVNEAELLVRLRALADQTCLHILALLTRHDPLELSAQEIMAELDLTQPTASRHLRQLSTAGFILERRHGGATKRYRPVPGHIAHTLQAVERWLAEPDAGPSGDGEREPWVAPELARFLDRTGRLTSWPARRRDQMLILTYLVARFTPDRVYSEPEVNALLNRWHTWGDHAKLRRALYDERLLDRTSDGARYWRADAGSKTESTP